MPLADETSIADKFVAEVAKAVAERMTATRLRGEDLRERTHLDPFTKDECERRMGVRPPARILRSGHFPGLGPVDVVLGEPRALIELKWAYQATGKIFESLWDAIKLALLGPIHFYPALYVGTGASLAEWKASESADLFTGGEFDPAGLWTRLLVPPRGPNYGRTVGEDLIIGARGNRPLRAHNRIAVRPVAANPVAGDYELRVVRVAGVGPLVDWSSLAPQPPTTNPTTLESVELPARVTQAWIERTVPRLSTTAVAPFLRDLRSRGWSDLELEERVIPHLRSP